MNNEILILMDDSGKININENSCIYGGLFFFSNQEYINFINKYKSIVKSLKCNYCNQKASSCNQKCVELKGTTRINSSDNRRIFNLLKKQNNFGVFINNKKLYNNIINDKAARGRYSDYAQKRIVKEIVMYAIANNKVDIKKLVKLNIKIDQAKTKSNGYYNLKNSIYEELVSGIINYDYSIIHKPIITNGLIIDVKYFDSKSHYGIQSADFISHYLHNQYNLHLLNRKDIISTTSFIEVKLFLP